MTGLDVVDRALLERLQVEFPLTPQPFQTLGKILGLSEAEVLSRVRRLKEEALIRQIGAIFDTRRLGYQTTLVAFRVDEEALEEVAVRISAHPGVSHNYARNHHYNLWFTLAIPPDQNLDDEIRRLAALTDVDDWLHLPALRTFKIKTHFRLTADAVDDSPASRSEPRLPGRDFAPDDIPYVRALQQDLPLTQRPFARVAAEAGLLEDGLLEKARELKAAGIIRRFAAVLRHRQVGFAANGMCCWVVPDSRIEEVGRLAASLPQVSHCYQRPAYPSWPYTLFTMIHGQSPEEVEGTVNRIAESSGISDYRILYSTREFKKERVRYFEEER